MTIASQQQPARVAVVSVGAITSQGPTASDLWQGAEKGRVAIGPVRHMSMEGFRTGLAGEVQDEHRPRGRTGYPNGYRDRAVEFALVAAEEAMSASGLGTDDVPSDRWGVVVGSCNAGLISGRHWYLERMRGGSADPALLMFVPPQAIAEALAGRYRIKGPALSVNTACAAGANAIGYAAELIRWGEADAVLTGGSDALSDVLVAGFNALESLSPEPAAPYSRDRLGLSLGEGSGMLVLVREDLARKLGLPVVAEVAGYGLSADGYDATAPHPGGRGASRAIQAALRSAGVAADEVGYVNSHGTGTAKNDPAETKATKLGLGEAAHSVAVSSTKSMIGHLLGAAGAVEAIVTVRALEEQTAPPTANFTEPDPECDLDYVPNVSRPLDTSVALSNNFAFGGANASLVLTRNRASTAPVPRPDRVVVTGVGALTPAGTGPAALWDAWAAERDCTMPERDTRVARVDVDVSEFLTAKQRRRMDRLGIFAVISSRLALEAAGLDIDDDNAGSIGTVLGTGIGPMEAMEAFSRPLFEDGPRAASPAVFPNTVYNAATGQVSMHVRALGPTSTVTTGHAAGAAAVVYAADLLKRDQAAGMLAIAADTLTDAVVDGYRDLSSGGPDGFAVAEAGIAVLLERRSAALARGAAPLAEVLGYGIAGDGIGVGRWSPGGRGLERAMRLAIDRAGLAPSDVTAVWSSIAGLDRADDAERAALRRLFGDAAGTEGPAILAPKKLIGEPIGAGGALNLALAVEAWSRGQYRGPVLVNSSSLGGTHVSIVLAPAS
ncbi:beta-ketoacyl-[acyl-carrier-protein] synthase family protein [Jiangella alkaliphila]|uniref:3-oxoacyl-[acyl-carrier-protein] synthase II n=1 Tax=Jiangella alkaliphila TaxID=419479 RepID=A0A1H2I6S7_9ACTN|nr:beta-ketoacyl-[acyl-carrier-protein] synthase family protein [Jiangella alkaliphila]SDU39774.1 3-oxoacyl-[acyl-carrier-protein] synthase II [Jiangella alkaliphila]